MTPELVITLLQRTIETTLYIMGPILIAAMVVGLAVSVFQTVTSLQEQTLSFLPKVMAVFGVTIFMFPWAIRFLTDFTVELFNLLTTLNK